MRRFINVLLHIALGVMLWCMVADTQEFNWELPKQIGWVTTYSLMGLITVWIYMLNNNK